MVSIVVFSHLAMLLLIPWPNMNYTLPIVLPIGILDALAISFAIQLVAKRVGRTEYRMSDPPEVH